mgnify:CR=1 FL=1
MYRSVPITGYQNLMNSITQYHIRLNGVPGFIQKTEHGELISEICCRYFCPIIDREGILLQCRSDRSSNGWPKIYLAIQRWKRKWLFLRITSAFCRRSISKTILLTEGSMKANVAHELSGKLFRTPSSFVAVAGVSQFNSIKQLFKDLKDYGCEVVYDCLDMDKFQIPM